MEQKIIEKIKKLLERTEENGCTPGEAATASAQVAMLLAKHNLTIDQINQDELELVKEEFIKDTKSCSSYQAEIALSLASHFGISVFIRKKSSNGRALSVLACYGEKLKVEAFVKTFQFVYRVYQKSWSDFHKKLDISTREKNEMRMSYLEGFVDGVTNEIIREENANALVVSKSQAVKDFEQTFTGTHKFSVSSLYNWAVHDRGYSDGSFAQRNRHRAVY